MTRILRKDARGGQPARQELAMVRGRELVVARVPDADAVAEREQRSVRDGTEVGAARAQHAHAVARTLVVVARRALQLMRHAVGGIGALLADKFFLCVKQGDDARQRMS